MTPPPRYTTLSTMARTTLYPIQSPFLQAAPLATHSIPTQPLRSDFTDLAIAVIHPSILLSFLAWICLSLAMTIYLVPRTQRGKSPSPQSRISLSINSAIMMLAIQIGLMLFRLHCLVPMPYNVRVSGPQGEKVVDPLWMLAAGCWVLGLALALSVVGVFGIMVEIEKWSEVMRKGEEKPLCP